MCAPEACASIGMQASDFVNRDAPRFGHAIDRGYTLAEARLAVAANQNPMPVRATPHRWHCGSQGLERVIGLKGKPFSACCLPCLGTASWDNCWRTTVSPHLERRISSRFSAVREAIWLGWQGSNLRMPVPKTGALPLGYTPAMRAPIAGRARM